MFCSNCGSKISENEKFCSNCGTNLATGANNTVVTSVPVYVKNTVPGNGLSVAGMVLGIIAIVFGFIYAIYLTTSDFKLDMAIYHRDVAAYAFGMIFIPSVLSLVGLPLSISGLVKHKNGKNITGIILNSITIVLAIFIFIYVIANYG